MADYRRNKRNNRNDNRTNEINEIIQNINKHEKLTDIDIKDLLDEKTGYAYKIAEISKKSRTKLKTTQLRKYFDAIRKMEGKNKWEDIEPKFYLLKPRMAAGVGRDLVPREFYDVIIVAMNKVNIGNNDEKLANFKVFVEFFESIVAYHKFLGGD